MEYSFFELATKAYPIVKSKGYVKGDTAQYIKDNYNDLPEKTTFVEIDDFVKWAENKEKERSTDYIRSVLDLIKNKTVKEYQINLLLSALNSYFKDIKAQEERDNNPSEFVGDVGSYVSFEVKDMKAISSNYYSYRGPETTFWRLVGTDNNIYMWSTSLDFEVGDTITAKVKDHRNYKGEHQTVITRGKVLNHRDEVPQELPADDFTYTGDLLKDIFD